MTTPYIRLNIQELQSGSAEQILKYLVTKISDGTLPTGVRLPPVRVLAHQLGISKNTVNHIYFELADRGLIQAKEKIGYLVNDQGKPKPTAIKLALAHPHQILAIDFPAFVKPPVSKKKTGQKQISLSSVFIGAELLPFQKLEQCFRSVLKQPGLHYLYDNQGYEPLRQIIAQRLSRRGIEAKPEWVVTTTGSQQALDVCTKILRNKTIATENPAYAMGKLLFTMNGMTSIGLPLDPFYGINQKIWSQELAKAKPSAIYLTSNFQNPTGYSYTTAEMQFILQMSKVHEIGIIEDDWGSDMLPFSEFRTPLRALGGNNVLYINSFTKKLLPSLRIGYVLGNDETTKALTAAKRVGTLGNATLIEATLFEFMDRGYFDQHLKSMQKEMDFRYQNCLRSLETFMPSKVRWTTPGGGPVLWVEVPHSVKIEKVIHELRAKNVLLDPRTEECFFGVPHLHGFKIGFAYHDSKIMSQGLEILGSVLRKYC